MKVLALTQYGRRGASSRLRVYQYLPSLLAAGVELEVCPLLDDWYLDYLYANPPRLFPWKRIVHSYWQRFCQTIKGTKYDLVWIQREVFPWLPAFAEHYLAKSGVPYVVDYDDAVFHRYDLHRFSGVRKILGPKIPSVMKNAAIVLAGNKYLADKAIKSGASRVELLPTVVDISKYQVRSSGEEEFTVGWIGTPHTVKYLQGVACPLSRFLTEENARLVIVGATECVFNNDEIRVAFLRWSEETEVRKIQSFDVGIMPLPDKLWEKGKCGYKLIQYMACGKPVVASPIGANCEIVKHGVNGYLADDSETWLRALQLLKQDKSRLAEMGLHGRQLVANHYSLQATAPALLSYFGEVVNK